MISALLIGKIRKVKITMREKQAPIAILIKKALNRAIKEAFGFRFKTEEIHLEHPDNEKWGD